MKMKLNERYESSYSFLEESFSALRTNLRFAKDAEDIRIIAVTSPGKDEGKTTITYGLAKSLAKDGQTVLLMDCNLRTPAIDKCGNYEVGRGLVNILINDVIPAEVFVPDPDHLNLDIILAGSVPPNPVELMGSIKMKNLLISVKDYYDYILLDTPGICLAPDAGILSNYADATILIVEKGRTQGEDLEKSLNRIDHLNGKMLGFVFNDIKGLDE